ncbi:MAG: flippase-like domain-containing protein [Deltaproteobacteria bacterium]|nr:flippase-like domain-containing protein [Deltaproteobacteria bacterium]
MVGERDRPRSWLDVVRWVGAPLLALLVYWRVDVRAIGQRLAHLDVRFVVLFLALSVPFYLLCAWRWHFTAARLGAALPFQRALREYYLSTLLNQLMPVGVAGDVIRAARHRQSLAGTREGTPWGPAATAVVVERFSGVLALGVFVIASGALWFAHEQRRSLLLGAGPLVGLGTLALLFWRAAQRSARLAKVTADVRAALVDGVALRFQLAVSLGAVLMLLGMFFAAAHAAGIAMSLAAVVQVVPLVLAATTFPWAFAGLGPREAITGALFALMGLTATDGVAVSITFGALSLVASAPGAIVLLLPTREPG